MAQRFRIGNNLSVIWLLYESDGNIHDLEGRDIELYMTCGGYKYPVTDYTVTENAVAWTFPAAMQTKTGYYKLVLLERDSVRGLYSFDVAEAFCLEPKDALTNIETIIDEDATVQVKSVLTYAHITNLASIDVVESGDGEHSSVVVRLTNGKAFTLPFSTQGGGGGGEGGGGSLPFSVIDSLYSTSKTNALSADKGRVLREMIEAIPSGGGGEGGGGGSEYVLPAATVDFLGGIILGFPQSGDKFPVALDNVHRAYATVPAATGSKLGTVKLGYENTGKKYALKLDDQGRAYVEISGSGGGGGDDDTPGTPGRSITGVQNWYKLCASENVQATPMEIADPSSAAGGSWSLTAGTPTAQYPYLRCFMQVNYDQPLASGYSYTRSSAFTARYFNSDSSQEYNDLQEAIEALRDDMDADLQHYNEVIAALNAALENLRSTIGGSITDQLGDLRDRLSQIDGSDVALIRDNANGLWGVLTSWQSATGDKKAFADIIANAQNAQVLLQTGSTFFDRAVGGNVTLDGLLGQLAARLTEQQVRGLIQSATISVDSAALNSVIAASQSWWKKTINGEEVLYPYDLFWEDFLEDEPEGTLYDYSVFMQKAPADGGPDGDANRPDGPYEEVVIVSKFSQIKQAVDEISASVDTTKYMWQNGNTYTSYDAFETQYANRSSTYTSYTYEQYVTNVLGYTKIEVGAALSNITQTSGELRSIVGDMGYYWEKNSFSGKQYARYAVPSNKTRNQYVTEMQAQGWTLKEYASQMSVIDQFPGQITSLVQTNTLCWIDDSAANGPVILDYDAFREEYAEVFTTRTYEEYVIWKYPNYALTVVTDAFSRIKQTAQSISAAVEDISDHETRLGALEIKADEIDLSVSKAGKCWKDLSDGTLYPYDEFLDEYEEVPNRPLEYEAWVANVKNCVLSDAFTEVSGIKVKSDKIWAGIGDGNDVKASIEILADAETSSGKIILDADNVIINGGLQAGVVKAGSIESAAVTTDKLAANAVTAGKIDAGAITTDKLAAGSVTAAKIATGVIDAAVGNFIQAHAEEIFANFISTAGNGSYITIQGGFICFYDVDGNLRIKMGQENGDSAPVLKFFSAEDDENALYDLGPNGITQLGYDVTVPEWRATRLRYTANKLTRNSQYNPTSYQAVTLYQYIDATRITVIGSASGGLQFYNPVTKQWQNEHSPYHEKFFNADNGLFVAPTAGYYLAYAYKTTGTTASVPLYDFSAAAVAALGTHYLGSMELKNVDITTYAGTIDSWNDYDAS